MDRISKEHRSWNMSRIRAGNTAPEKAVRSVLHGMGYRFRVHRRDLPGSPDIVMPKYRTIIFVHGCFWHRHTGCKYAYRPKSRVEFWEKKLAGNVKRDRISRKRLTSLGWRVVTVWECETRDCEQLRVWLRSLFDQQPVPECCPAGASACLKGMRSCRSSRRTNSPPQGCPAQSWCSHKLERASGAASGAMR